ncbi:oxidoreductase [Lysobacter enzymogenes]|nr:FAD-dependent oxidoreductase [Lysobacter enzymogenes]QCW28000.1 oxidoreductase [Lysobacter enzymogenes]
MTERCDVLVVGAGPAGWRRRRRPRRTARGSRWSTCRPTRADRCGGATRAGAPDPARERLDALLAGARVRWLGQAQVVAAEPGQALVEQAGTAIELSYGALVLATGARELLLPFPGWTSPGVTGAGGLQALVKQGWPIAGRRVLVAGSGPLLLAAAATAQRHGARVVAICEQAPAARLHAFARRLWRWPGKLAQAAALRARLAGAPYRAGRWIVAAHGEGRVAEAELNDGERIAVDQLAVGYGLVPNLELAQQLGCELQAHGAHACVRVDALLRTSVASVYAAGEACGIGGRDCALVEGAMAGHAAAGAVEAARAAAAARGRAFAARCCRNTSGSIRGSWPRRRRTPWYAAARTCASARSTPRRLARGKLATRCGMGGCQAASAAPR